jgi:hypothetical protein
VDVHLQCLFAAYHHRSSAVARAPWRGHQHASSQESDHAQPGVPSAARRASSSSDGFAGHHACAYVRTCIISTIGACISSPDCGFCPGAAKCASGRHACADPRTAFCTVGIPGRSIPAPECGGCPALTGTAQRPRLRTLEPCRRRTCPLAARRRRAAPTARRTELWP